ncbi:MAG: 23S rRNA (adenine(2503)-C(2))-methyltransferase RlmN [Candidatus Omnitrophica bacterium]|nr:23S rRNA (adenine(2503)-C(2))-methyltransferase RlmN [Candidatus Omnitrophota bacterium]
MKKDIKNLGFQELKDSLLIMGFPSHSAGQIFNWVYKRRIEDFNLMTNISKEARQHLSKEFFCSRVRQLKKEVSCDGTAKFLFGLFDGHNIETVLIPEGRRNTLCVSTQVGCKFNCSFCYSGQFGFKRDLNIAEIVNQYLSVSDLIAPAKITNVVFMGIGEPLDNFSNTIGSIKVFSHRQGISLGKRKICISTCGLSPKIKELSILNLGVRLSVSLHATDDNIRSRIMPVNKKYPIASLMSAVRQFLKNDLGPVTFEYILLHRINTSNEMAEKLEKWLRGINYKINIIPCNMAKSIYKPPREDEVNCFLRELKTRNIFFTVRKPRGQDINAACGQLKARQINSCIKK